jgi:DNA ligase-1
MPDLADGQTTEMQGSGAKPYVLKNVGGVYSCSCPAWRNQSLPIEKRTCKHLKKYRGEAVELARISGSAAPAAPKPVEGEVEVPVQADEQKGEKEAPPLLLAHSWENDIDPKGWLMSEKLDGVRAYWNGKQFISRLGNVYHAPDWFCEGLPDMPLDGELWGGRKQFQKTVGIVKRHDKSDHWKKIQYVVFDSPSLNMPFEHRLNQLQFQLSSSNTPYAKPHDHEPCLGIEHLRKVLMLVEKFGGEGLMLRKPGSLYEAGRSTTLLKVKTFHDAEAIVVGYEAGKGKHKGVIGSLIVEKPDGTRFCVGTGLSDKERANPPAVDAIITYRYQELTEAGVPRFPSYVGIRHDFAWPGKK